MVKRSFIVNGLACFLVAATLALGGWSQVVWAIGLDEAKAQGLVGEQPTGYLGAVKPNAEVNALVADINAKRQEKYVEIAQRNKTSVSVVEALAGKTAIEKTPPGQYIQAPSGEWMKK